MQPPWNHCRFDIIKPIDVMHGPYATLPVGATCSTFVGSCLRYHMSLVNALWMWPFPWSIDPTAWPLALHQNHSSLQIRQLESYDVETSMVKSSM